MSTTITPVKSVGCFQSVVNFHNEGILKLSDTCACVSRLEIKNDGDDGDSCLKKIAKMFALIVIAVPLFIFQFARTMYNKVTDCCAKKAEEINNAEAAKKTDEVAIVALNVAPAVADAPVVAVAVAADAPAAAALVVADAVA